MAAAPDSLEIEDVSLVWMWEVILIPFLLALGQTYT